MRVPDYDGLSLVVESSEVPALERKVRPILNAMKTVNPIPSYQPEEIDYLKLDDIIEKQFNNDKENLIMILQEIQMQYNYIPGPAIEYLAEKYPNLRKLKQRLDLDTDF